MPGEPGQVVKLNELDLLKPKLSKSCGKKDASMMQNGCKEGIVSRFPDLDPGFGVGGCPELVALQWQRTDAEVAQVAPASLLSPSTL